jgi:hypothetical protein
LVAVTPLFVACGEGTPDHPDRDRHDRSPDMGVTRRIERHFRANDQAEQG